MPSNNWGPYFAAIDVHRNRRADISLGRDRGGQYAARQSRIERAADVRRCTAGVRS
jgi:hypothetical protein